MRALWRQSTCPPIPIGRPRAYPSRRMVDKLKLTDDEWRARLTPEQFSVLRRAGTERAGTGCLLATKDPGTYVCAGCGNPLFPSGEKFESGTGWPSFTKPVGPDAVITH